MPISPVLAFQESEHCKKYFRNECNPPPQWPVKNPSFFLTENQKILRKTKYRILAGKVDIFVTHFWVPIYFITFRSEHIVCILCGKTLKKNPSPKSKL